MRSPANLRTRSSWADRKKRDSPGSPWRPERPRSWLSIRRDSWRSVPSTASPPRSTTCWCSSATWRVLSSMAARRAAFHSARGGSRRALALGPQRLLGQVLHVAAEHDVDAAPGHVGGHGDGAEPAGLGDDVRLTLVVLGVEDLGLDAPLLEQAVDPLRLLDGHGADQHRLALFVALGDLVGQGLELGLLGLLDYVAVVLG